MYHADPAQPLTTAGEELQDDLDHDLSELSEVCTALLGRAGGSDASGCCIEAILVNVKYLLLYLRNEKRSAYRYCSLSTHCPVCVNLRPRSTPGIRALATSTSKCQTKTVRLVPMPSGGG